MSTPAPATTEWVPLWDLNGGVNLDYKGAWAAGTYKDGEIVVHNGIAYLCVRQTTKTPTPWPVALPYGTSLPASPVDGQEAVLVDSVTNPSYQWRFRYNAQSTAANKWECVGGAEWVATIETEDTTTSPTYVDLANGPIFTVPRAGVYNVRHGASVKHNTANGTVYLAVSGVNIDCVLNCPVANQQVPIGRAGRINLSAGQAFRLMVAQASGIATYSKRHLTIAPVRVS